MRFSLATVAILVVFCLSGVAHAAIPAAVKALTPPVVAFWDRVGSCETGGGGPAKWDWGARRRHSEGTTFQGGVGFYSHTWDEWARELGLLGRYPDAFDAPRLVQIAVAQYGLTRHRGYWGCLH